MSLLHRLLSCALPIMMMGLFAGVADAFDLSGAWTPQLPLCGKVFKKIGKRVTLTTASDLYGGGFIIDGDRVRGKAVRCRIDSRKEDGPVIHLSIACTTEVATEQIQFDLKVVNDDTVSKTFPGTDIGMDYHRCTL